MYLSAGFTDTDSNYENVTNLVNYIKLDYASQSLKRLTHRGANYTVRPMVYKWNKNSEALYKYIIFVVVIIALVVVIITTKALIVLVEHNL